MATIKTINQKVSTTCSSPIGTRECRGEMILDTFYMARWTATWTCTVIYKGYFEMDLNGRWDTLNKIVMASLVI